MNNIADNFKSDRAFIFYIGRSVSELDAKTDKIAAQHGDTNESYRALCGSLSAYKYLHGKTRSQAKTIIEQYVAVTEPKDNVFKQNELNTFLDMAAVFGLNVD